MSVFESTSLLLACILVGGCGSESPQKLTPSDPVVQATKVRVQGPMPVLMAENMVKDVLPQLLACWTDTKTAPCGTITVSTQGDHHGNRQVSVGGTLDGPDVRLCARDIISKLRPPTPELSPPTAGLTVDLVYAPSLDTLKSCTP